jgi:hypothetical protein
MQLWRHAVAQGLSSMPMDGYSPLTGARNDMIESRLHITQSGRCAVYAPEKGQSRSF